ncbi:FGGY-family carbohydrate kinase [Chelativorans salis]|uniref:FGGY-family carbohydrate kinase n=1 Tax=Chelativorans salis TaxID=2978478 RepID=A0ABT2LVF4_9HYPH|nr:FGGY-family carbohydrate kinase [Chelativorans sp. EGI FJ00035]MCT7378489.1 FGGY-family carbohydrate kinase [Chelativorans sp. EGI FJ00035]
MKHYLGVDIGTFETKGVLVDETGGIVASAARPHKMLVPQPGWAEHRPREDWWGDFVFVTQKVLTESGVDPKTIRAVGCSAIGPCMLPVDAAGEPLSNAILYGVDTRAAREIEALDERIGAETILERCGNALTSQSVGPKILWLKNNRPELYGKSAKFLNSTSYVNYRLTGRYVIDHYSAANASPLYDVEKRDWVFDLADDIVQPDQLPDLLWTTDIAGEVTSEAAAETGLAVGTPVIAGTIDAAAEALSVGVLSPGDMMVMYGSTIFTIMVSDGPVRDRRLWYAPWLFEGEHASMAGLATSGTLTHWFRDQFARELEAEEAFAALAEEAASAPPGAGGLVFLPYFSGERTPIHDPDAKGVLFGLNLTHTRGDIYRALLEGIACGTAHIVDTYREIDRPPGTIYAVGGGTKNTVWAQATSDISGLDQVLRARTIGASYGDAFLAAVAVGDARKGDIAGWNPVERTIAARPEHKAVYGRQYRVFRRLYEQTRDLMAEMSGAV